MGHVGLHEEVGQLLMLQVDAGLELVRSVGNHHTGGDAPSPLTSLIHVADNICKDMGMGYLKDEKGTFSPAVLESLGLDEGDIEGIRRAMEDTIVSEVGQIVSTCLAPTPSVARSPLGTTRSPDVSGSPGTGSPVAASPESGAPRSSDAAEPAEHATNANDAVEGPHDDGATRSADAASRSDDGARTAEETDRNANLRRLAELLEKIEAQLWADTSLNDEEREDLLVDVGNLRSQLTKSVINSPIVRTLIRPLTEIESVCELATDMSDLLRKIR